MFSDFFFLSHSLFRCARRRVSRVTRCFTRFERSFLAHSQSQKYSKSLPLSPFPLPPSPQTATTCKRGARRRRAFRLGRISGVSFSLSLSTSRVLPFSLALSLSPLFFPPFLSFFVSFLYFICVRSVSHHPINYHSHFSSNILRDG